MGDYDGKIASSYLDCMTDENWMKWLEYLPHISSALDAFNLTLQGKDVHKFCPKQSRTIDTQTSKMGSKNGTKFL